MFNLLHFASQGCFAAASQISLVLHRAEAEGASGCTMEEDQEYIFRLDFAMCNKGFDVPF